MGLISMIAAPVMPQTRPYMSVAAAVHDIVQPASEPSPVWPVSPSASSAALVRDHWRDANFIRRLEAEGLELDGIPFIGDEAVLLDDLPREDSAAEEKQDGNAARPPVPASDFGVVDPDQTPDHRLTEAAARAYEDERAISGLHPVEVAQTEPIANPTNAQTSDTGARNTGPENRPRR